MKKEPDPLNEQGDARAREQVVFTERQLSVLQCWAECKTIAQVAAKLQLSENTVQTQLKRMRKKLGVTRTFDVFRYAQKRGWVS